jgi:hypothetical protein
MFGRANTARKRVGLVATSYTSMDAPAISNKTIYKKININSLSTCYGKRIYEIYFK